jgi:hypothetical protein
MKELAPRRNGGLASADIIERRTFSSAPQELD